MTQKKTDPRALALVLLTILLIAGAVTLRLWANDQRLGVPTFRAMSVSANGNAYIVIGNTLHVESAAGESLHVIPLSQWGVRAFHGDIAALADGSVILARGRMDGMNLGETVRAARRVSATSHDAVEILMRCTLEGACTPLDGGDAGAEPVGRVFGLAVDETRGFVYVNEPARHRIVQLDMNGALKDESTGGWLFPNNVRVRGERIGVVDTDHHRYVELHAGAEGIGEPARGESIMTWPDVTMLRSFPSEALVDSTGALWMLVADNNMADAWLYRYPANGLPQRISLPEKADPVALEEVAGRVLVADQQHFRIHCFNLAGQLQEDFGSAPLKAELSLRLADHARYEAIFEYSLLAVLAIALPALGAGLWLQRKAERAAALPKAEDVVANDTGAVMFTGLESQFAQLNGEFIFWRKFTVLGTVEARRFGVLFAVLNVALIGTLVMLEMNIAMRDGVPAGQRLLTGPALLVGAMFMFTGIAGWMSRMFERLVITREGIRYVSFMPRLFTVFGIMPSWFLHWSEIASIQLVHSGMGRYQLAWRYVITDAKGAKHRIHPLSWRPAGEPEVGIPLRTALRQTPQSIRDVIHRTWLFRLLGRQRAAMASRKAA